MSIRSRRYKSLKRQGFQHFEAYDLIYPRKGKGLQFNRSLWFNSVRKQRAKEFGRAKDNASSAGWSKAQFRRVWQDFIRDKYMDEGWLSVGVGSDVWQMFRDLRTRAIERGWYKPPEKRGSHRRKEYDPGTGLYHRIDKGQVRQQRARARMNA